MRGGIGGKMAKSRDILTTGEVARICKVAPRTVSKWFDSGELGGYRIPGSKDRRIPRGELLVFMDKHGIPRGVLESDKQRALIVSRGASNNSVLEKALAENNFEVQSADSAFAAGVLAERLKPQIIFWEVEAESQSRGEIPRNIRVIADLQKTKVVALTNGQEEWEMEDRGFDACLNLALDESRLKGLIAELVGVARQRVAGNLRLA